uniref:Immunoglobulin V-set domain-containing protein n=1 Tax=Esox lucius TaxID=8010 RepID=A0A3P8YPP9_ESOLU
MRLVSIEDNILVYGYEGSGAEIRCPYDNGYEHYGKYLCTENCDYPDILIETKWQVSRAERGRFSLYHDTMSRKFIVFVSKLTFTDAGKYWCGVSRNAKDIYTGVILRVVKGKVLLIHSHLTTHTSAEGHDPRHVFNGL